MKVIYFDFMKEEEKKTDDRQCHLFIELNSMGQRCLLLIVFIAVALFCIPNSAVVVVNLFPFPYRINSPT